MFKFFFEFIFGTLLLFISNIYANESIITNLPLWREVSGWDNNFKYRNYKQIITDVDLAMSAEVVPWRIAVIQGEDWSYQWGFFAYYYKALALYNKNKLVDAYNALIDASSYLPDESPSVDFHKNYWDWYLLAGKLCARFGRNQDANWYLTKIRNSLPSNDIHYIEATAKLASTRRYQGKLLESRDLYNELFLLHPYQKTRVWHDYIRLLFDCGNFEQGIQTIINGVKANGISSKYKERDYFIQDACTHWHSFSEYDIYEWYNLLGQELESVKLERGSEDLIALLINERKLIAKIYPDIINKKPNDLIALKKRIEAEKTNVVLHTLFKREKNFKKVNKRDRKHIIPRVGSFTEVSSTNILIENAVNAALLKTQKIWQAGGGSPRIWEEILENFSTNDLQKVIIDGESALFHTYSTLGAIYAYNYKTKIAEEYFKKALNVPNMGGNADRLVDLLTRYAALFLRADNRDLKEAEYLYNWADEINDGNMRLWVIIQSGFSGIALINDGPKARIDILQDIVNTCGCMLRRAVYERLARDYYRIGNFRMGFNTYVEGIKRSRFKMEAGYWDHMVDGLIMNRSFHNSDELRQLRKILRAGALRYPATIKYASTIARLFSLADEPWIDEHIKLAEIEENNNYSDENWFFISNTVFKSPSIRAGLLYIKAQAARNDAGTNNFDWSGWIAGWRRIDSEIKSGKPTAPTGSGTYRIANNLYIEQIINYSNRISKTAIKLLGNAICQRASKLRNEPFDKIISLYMNLHRTNILFNLHFQRMSQKRKTSPKNPSYKALIELGKISNQSQKMSLLSLLKRKLNLEKNDDKKFEWKNLINKIEKNSN